MQTYAMSPVGKRKILCGCNDEFDPMDPGTECFETGEVAQQRCPACGYFPWYRIKATTGGSAKKTCAATGIPRRRSGRAPKPHSQQQEGVAA